MRLNPPIAVLTLLALSFAYIPVSRHIFQSDRRSDSCAVALAYFQYLEKKNRDPLLIYDEGLGGATSEDVSTALRERPEIKHHPDFEIYQHAAKIQGLSPIIDCPNVAEWLDANKILHRPAEVIRKLLEPHKGFNGEVYPWSVVSMSMPAISKDRKRSLFESSIHGADLGGSIYRIEMRRDAAGLWQIFYEVVVAVS